MQRPVVPAESPAQASSARARALTAWAGLGVTALLLEAAVRMGRRAEELFRTSPRPSTLELAGIAAVAVAFAYGEGYRALHRRYAPYVIARAREAGERLRGCFPVLGAPLFAMGLVGAPGRALAKAWAGVAAIVLAVLLVRLLPPLARAAVDLGVALALACGAVSLAARLVSALRGP